MKNQRGDALLVTSPAHGTAQLHCEKPGTTSVAATQFASTGILLTPVFRDDHSSEHSDVRRVVLGQEGGVDPATPRRWRLADLTMANMKKFFSLCINMGLVRKKNVADYSVKNHPSTYVTFYAKVMPFRLFAFISRVLHAGDPDAPVRGRMVLNAVFCTSEQIFNPDVWH